MDQVLSLEMDLQFSILMFHIICTLNEQYSLGNVLGKFVWSATMIICTKVKLKYISKHYCPSWDNFVFIAVFEHICDQFAVNSNKAFMKLIIVITCGVASEHALFLFYK